MPLYPEYGTIFIHIPKTAGQFIHMKLFKGDFAQSIIKMTGWGGDFSKSIKVTERDDLVPLQHATFLEIKKNIIEKINDYKYIFAFVRNPFARLVSEYNFNKILYDADFNVFVTKIHEYLKNKYTDVHLKPQFEFVINEDGKIEPTITIYKMEELHETVKDIVKTSGVNPIEPDELNIKINESIYEKDYKSYYNDESIKIVREIYKNDFELFGYSFEL